ncbi:MAG: hypothetical protein VST68_13225 [Nitrospirota bacterium]|nr:hypothetical protein [Nitrospirota bacterium]
MPRYFIIILSFFLCQVTGPVDAEVEDARVNLTTVVIPLISLTQDQGFMSGGELFRNGRLSTRSAIHYLVSVKNQTDDPIDASSLIVVIDQIIEMARGRNVTDELELVGFDGYTEEGKPYYRVPSGSSAELRPFAESSSVEIQIRNPDLLRIGTPSFQVWGVRKTKAKKIEELGQLLIKKGILTPEEAAQLLDPPRLSNEP